jgi:holo-[acyl-carrier protein] synthase
VIYGTGIDIVAEARIAEVHARRGRQLVRRLLHPAEFEAFAQSRKPDNYLAKAWAAKEAFSKALATGVRGFGLADVGVVRSGSGAPRLIYSRSMQDRLTELGILHGHVSLTDDAGMVCAFVVLER